MKRVFVSIILLAMVMILTGCDEAIVDEYLPVEELAIEETSVTENTPEDDIDEYEKIRALAIERAAREGVFVQLDNRNIIAPYGTEYVRLSMTPFVTFFGSKNFVGGVADEGSLPNIWAPWELGMYSLDGDDNLGILLRMHPRSDNWLFYRKASLPPLDLSLDNCIRFELIRELHTNRNGYFSHDLAHMSCGMGITDPDKIQAFLADIRSQPTAREAGLHDLVRRPDGRYENLVHYGTVFGFFENVANLAVPLRIDSFNGEAYAISFHYIDDYGNLARLRTRRVLPEEWLDILREASCQ